MSGNWELRFTGDSGFKFDGGESIESMSTPERRVDEGPIQKGRAGK